MAGGETFLQLEDGSIVGATNPLPTQGVAGATSDVKIHGNVHTTQWIEPNSDGSVNVKATPVAGAPTFGQGQVGALGAAAKFIDISATRFLIKVRNISNHTVFIGAIGVLVTNGHAIPAGGQEDFPTGAALYVCSGQAGDVITWASFG